MRMIKAFIFDLDGTLVQTEPLRALAHARTAVALSPDHLLEADVVEAAKDWAGIPHTETMIGLMKRFRLEESARRHMAAFGVNEPWQVLAAIDSRFYAAMTSDPETLRRARLPHSIALLRKVRRQGYRAGLATMSTAEQAQRALNALRISAAFEAIVTCDEVRRGKPDAEIYWLTAQRLALPPAACLVIEDSAAGVQAALAAGMSCIALPNEFTRQPFDSGHLLEERWVVREPDRLMSVVQEMLAERAKHNE